MSLLKGILLVSEGKSQLHIIGKVQMEVDGLPGLRVEFYYLVHSKVRSVAIKYQVLVFKAYF